jgi:hypothetical protein
VGIAQWQKTNLERYLHSICKVVLIGYVFIAVAIVFRWYNAQMNPSFSTLSALQTLRCVGPATYFSTNFGAHPIVTFANTGATTLTGIDPMFTYLNFAISDPNNYLFSQYSTFSDDAIRYVSSLGATHIIVPFFSFHDTYEKQVASLIKSPLVMPVCVRGDSQIMVFKIK